MLANIVTESSNKCLAEPLDVLKCLVTVGSSRHLFYAQRNAHCFKIPSTICGPLSVGKRSGMPYVLTQFPASIVDRLFAVFLLVVIALVSSDSRSLLQRWAFRRFLSLTEIHGCPSRQIPKVPLAKRAVAGVDTSDIFSVLYMLDISLIAVDLLLPCHNSIMIFALCATDVLCQGSWIPTSRVYV